jgi:ParB-like nuclease domain
VLDALERSLRQFGFVQPVLARREDRTVIGGHQRLVAARRLGLTTVPVTSLDVSVEQARLLGLALNKISGSWDDALLARLLADLQSMPDLDLSLSGFGEDEVKDLLRSLEVREKREHVECGRSLGSSRQSPIVLHEADCTDAVVGLPQRTSLRLGKPRFVAIAPSYACPSSNCSAAKRLIPLSMRSSSSRIALLLDLLFDEPLKERKAAVIRAILGRAGERVELARDADLALESGLHCVPRRGVLGDPRSNGR